MEILEKVLGIAGVLVILAVFLFIMFIAIGYVQSWLDKGLSPNNIFPRNPKGEKVTPEQQKALNVGAILAANNRDFCDSLKTSKDMAKKNLSIMLERDWGISTPEHAIDRLESLKLNGHRKVSNYVLKNASKFLKTGVQGSMNCHSVYEEIGFDLLDKRLLEECPEEIEVAKKNMNLFDAIINATSFDDIKDYQGLFGSEETFSICIQIYYRFYEECRNCFKQLENLREMTSYLQEKGYLGSDLAELERIDVTAWDMGRLVNIARYSFDLGYIPEDLAWEYILYALKESEARYADWNEFARAYVIGRVMWGGKDANHSYTVERVKMLKEDEKSPWKMVSLH